MIRTDTENKQAALSDRILDAVWSGTFFDLIGDGIDYLYDEITERVEDLFGTPDDGKCTGDQVMPGFNV